MKYKILIIDDEEAVANSLRVGLKLCGIYDAHVENNGHDALAAVESSGPFDAYLIDQKMPEISGTELIKKLMNVVEDPLIYIVTAEDDGQALAYAEKSVENGGLPIKRYVPKPWPESLFSVDLRIDLEERELKKNLLRSVEKHYLEQSKFQGQLKNAQDAARQLEKQNAAMARAMELISALKHNLGNIKAGLGGQLKVFEINLNDSARYLKIDEKEGMYAGTLNVHGLKDITDDNLREICERDDVIAGLESKYPGFFKSLREFPERLERIKFNMNRFNEIEEFIRMVTSEDEPGEKTRMSANTLIDKSLARASCESFKNVKLEVSCPDDLEIHCYESKLIWALSELLTNSVKAMQPDGGTLSIRAYSDFEITPQTIIQIQDTGIGVPKERIHEIFVPLVTRSAIYGGKGASIAHRFLSGHEGTIEVVSHTKDMLRLPIYEGKSQGTILTIKLPSKNTAEVSI